MSDSVKRVVILATLLAEKKAEIEATERQLKDDKEAMRQIEREDLPLLMAEIGLSEIKLEDGTVVAVKEEVDSGISEANRAAAHQWLIDNGYGGLIKTEVAVQFDRGAVEEATACAAALQAQYGAATVKAVVHPQTLKSFVKEQLAAGVAIPFDLFGIFPYSVAKIQTKKGK